jgi:N-acyl-D-amino-acid deacylase
MNDVCSLLLRRATVIDGTGAPRFVADVAVTADRITAIGALGHLRAEREIDVRERVLCPGFIDAHAHDDRLPFVDPVMTPKLSQGVTTVVTGNCGVSLAPIRFAGRVPTPPLDLLDPSGEAFAFDDFASYLAALRATPVCVNVAPMVGHTTLRVREVADPSGPASAAQIAAMRAHVDEALAAGAIGVSTGTFYPPAAAAGIEELIAVCRPLSRHGGVYATHLRDEGDRVLEAIEETLRIGRALGVPVILSHHKVVGRTNAGRSVQTLATIEAAMRSQPVCLDCYPYDASSTILAAPRAAVARQTRVTWSVPHPEMAGRDVDAIAADWGCSREEAIGRLLPAGAIYFSMDEEDVQRILAFPPTMIGSDGLPHDARPHPRLWGTFPRVLGHYSRRLGLFPLETAVHKMTGLTAANFGLADRGVVRVGAHADLVILDPQTVDAQANFEIPERAAIGVDWVIVNGVPAWHQGAATGARSGQVLRRAQTTSADTKAK